MSDWKESDCARRWSVWTWAGGQGAYLAGDDERDGLDRGPGHLVRTCDFALGNVECAARQEAHPALRVGRLVLRKAIQLVILVLVVPDITISDTDVRRQSVDAEQ